MRKWISVLVAICLLTGCSDTILQKQTFTIEMGKDVYANPSLYVKDGVNTDGMSVKSLEAGIRKVDNRFVSGNNEYLLVGTYDFALVSSTGHETAFKIKIKDTQPPTLGNGISTVTLSIGQVVNWDDIFHATDLSGVSYELIPNIDTSVAGNYTCDLKVQDRYGNATTKSITIIVE